MRDVNPAEPRRQHRVLARRAAARLSVISLFALVLVAPGAQAATPRAAGPGAQAASAGCAAPSSARSAADPLALSPAPGGNPLSGASFFVDGPSHGVAAGEIARLLGIDADVPIGHYLPAFSDDESWAHFLDTTVASRLAQASATVQAQVAELEKIASEPEAQRISIFSEGGSPAGIAAFTNKLFCHNFTADPGTVPIITTYLMHPVLGGCSSTAQINAYMPLFRRRVNAIVTTTGTRRVVYLLELDAVGSSSCMASHGSLPAWERMLRYEVDRMATLPHAVVYVEGGYSDANNPAYAARILNAADIHKIRGFFTNDTHMNWTSREIAYGLAISRRTHGAHFIVNTAQNGHGPKLNPHPTRQGVEDLCNPPGRGLGPQPTTSTGYPAVDAFLWTYPPGNSSGSCHGGPPSGTWWPARALALASAANGQLGPGLPSRPY
ncbi:MAG TPA: glycoside hydrolase family 6 protein [Solirubrobacteraceae bacterium]|nr:glycoside hydrolase family 6 protein [Solirubrobacteraceae bacterium]